MMEMKNLTTSQDAIEYSVLTRDLLNFIEEKELEECGLNQENDAFAINSFEQANYIAKKLKEVRNKINATNSIADNVIASYTAKVNEWREKELSPLQFTENYLLSLLEDYARRQLAESDKKTLRLIEGKLSFRKQPPKFEYDDEALLAFLKERFPDFIRYKPAPDKVALKEKGIVVDGKLVVAGVPVSGVSITQQPEKFEFKVD